MPDAIPHAIVITQGDVEDGTKGDRELAPIKECNIGIYAGNSHTGVGKRTGIASFVLASHGSGVLLETKGY